MRQIVPQSWLGLGTWAAAVWLALAASSCKRSSAPAEGEQASAISGERGAALKEAPAQAEPAKDGPPPAITARSHVFLPSFVLSSGQLNAGKAVPVRVPAAPNGLLVLSCFHIFGPDGGLPAQLTASALPGAIQSAFLVDLDGKRFDIGPAFLVPDAKPFALPDASGDVTIFRAPAELAARALELAARLPPKGERVWLLSSLVSGGDQLLHPARVYYATDKLLTYQFDSSEIEFRATSGAPVVDGKGQIVALNLGGGPIQGVRRGFGVPLPSLRQSIERALASK